MKTMLNNITVNAQSSIHISGESNIFFDPFQIKEPTYDADIIFITHPHSDHFSPKDIQKVTGNDTIYVAPPSMFASLKKINIYNEKIILMEPGEKKTIKNMTVEAIAAYNVNKPFHPKKNGWLGYLITVDEFRIYVSGDMDVTPESKLIQCDIAMIPIGGVFTMNAKKAATYINDIKPKVAVPIHYGSMVGKTENAEVFQRLVDDSIDVMIMI